MPVTADGPGPAVPATQAAAPRARAGSSGFGTVAFAFLVVMAVATLPSPLYGLYRIRDHLSALTITVVFAIFAGGTIAVLLRDSAIAARLGRRGTACYATTPGAIPALNVESATMLFRPPDRRQGPFLAEVRRARP